MKTNLHAKTNGFTITELILVVTVIGILAGIVIVGYGAWRDKSATSQVKSDLTNVAAAMESARTFGNQYPSYSVGTTFDGTNTTKSVFTQTSGVALSYASGSGTTYCINGQSTVRSGITYFVSSASGDKKPQAGSCS
jgi:prepilin-type N-terminal cleavage/methylation domain-containing protein